MDVRDAETKPGTTPPPPRGRRKTAPSSNGDSAPKPEKDANHPGLGAGTPLEGMFHSERETPKKRDTALYRGLTEFYTQIGTFVSAFDMQCGQTIVAQASTCADAMEKLAAENPAVKKALQRLITGSAMGAVLMAHAPIAFAIAMHHVPALQERAAMMTAAMMADPNVAGFPG